MEIEDLSDKIFEIIKVLEINEGVALFASKKKGFENWFKLELCILLSKYGAVLPEEKRIDIVFNIVEHYISHMVWNNLFIRWNIDHKM